MTGTIKFITAVYFNFNFNNGQFVRIRINQFSNGHFELLDMNDYFQPQVVLDNRAIWIDRKFKKPARFLVLYDHHKHNDGTNKCPYMIFRVGKDRMLEDMTIEHFLSMAHRITKGMISENERSWFGLVLIARQTGDVHQTNKPSIKITAVVVLANTVLVTLRISPISPRTCAESTNSSTQNIVLAIKDGANNNGMNVSARPESDFEILIMHRAMRGNVIATGKARSTQQCSMGVPAEGAHSRGAHAYRRSQEVGTVKPIMTEVTIDEMRKKSTMQSPHTVNEFNAKHRVGRMRKMGSDLTDFRVILVRVIGIMTNDDEIVAAKSTVR
ncbi:hypothetical protein DFJ58DRAFT_860804 [Suillus subalutaceus]|uniref:uncharacterized protein n=1 Tax=Suillus subalutaceus TaxID=48586 RepID=UPI001B85F5BE|nr:uncharacterized protein DFJ58DRAFT_860804 [Suillus subalutaceus]KAG1838811.1 hypothetical protein DFJ58DRAFT_860804 [Suillus subalutaceus]